MKHVIEVIISQTYNIEVEADEIEDALEKVGNMYDSYIAGNADLKTEDREENWLGLVIEKGENNG